MSFLDLGSAGVSGLLVPVSNDRVRGPRRFGRVGQAGRDCRPVESYLRGRPARLGHLPGRDKVAAGGLFLGRSRVAFSSGRQGTAAFSPACSVLAALGSSGFPTGLRSEPREPHLQGKDKVAAGGLLAGRSRVTAGAAPGSEAVAQPRPNSSSKRGGTSPPPSPCWGGVWQPVRRRPVACLFRRRLSAAGHPGQVERGWCGRGLGPALWTPAVGTEIQRIGPREGVTAIRIGTGIPGDHGLSSSPLRVVYKLV